MYAAPPDIETTVYARLPESFSRIDQSTPWIEHRGAGPLGSFLEGPSFDREGRLYCVDLAHGRIFRISPQGDVEVFADYVGEPNGLKIHKDGRIFVADREHGVLAFDPVTAERTVIIGGPADGERFHGLNDLTFSTDGDLYFTDQGDSALEAPYGRVFRLRATGELDLLLTDLAGPNGLVLSRDEKVLYVALTRTNQIISAPLRKDQPGVRKCSVFIQLSGSPVGPDGMAIDTDGNLAVVHAGFGTVWLFSSMGEPIGRIRSCAGFRTTNVAFGGDDGRTLFITEAQAGVILQAKVPAPGVKMFSHC
ncbi:SMP-30/gluconolactonase/LRE family protein [Pseudomonas sp. NPDC088444]|uniref:SMP-30/gluconolactonase/LRE family protein n=1 Tax=Pseudomonas sp. NPDC088444 TaxID=3364456 RepID=UPI00384AC0AC